MYKTITVMLLLLILASCSSAPSVVVTSPETVAIEGDSITLSKEAYIILTECCEDCLNVQ